MTAKVPKDPPKPVPITSGQLTIALSSIRNMEAYLRWQGAQWVIALNLSALVAVLYRFISKPETPELFVLSVGCAIIAALDYEWYSVLRRDGKLLGLWNAKLVEHEETNGIDGDIEVFTSTEYQQVSSSRERLQRKLERITVGFIIVWATAAVAIFSWSVSIAVRI